MTDKHLPKRTVITEINENERRDFLKKLGKYSAFASVTTVTLMTASRNSAASEIGDEDLPPDSPGG